MIKLDVKDKKILAILDRNARMPITQIAKKTRLNKDVVHYRINNLEKSGVILGYYTLVDTHKLGYLTIRIYFDLININNFLEKSLISFLDKEFKAGQIFKIDGEYQLGILTWEKSIYELEEKLKILKQKFGEYIERYELSIFTELYNYSRRYLSDSENVVASIKQSPVEEISDTDLKILKEISANARITSVELSKILSIPQRTVVYRIKNLEKKKIICGYRINLNTSILGFENYFLEVYTPVRKNIKGMEKFAEKNKNCIGVDYVLHGADIEIETEMQSKKNLLCFIEEIKNKFKGIKKIKYWSTLEYLKINYLPK